MSRIRKLYQKLLELSSLKLYPKYLKKKQQKMINKKVLDIGCGGGLNLITKYREGYFCFGLDVSKKSISLASRIFKENGLKCNFLIADATKIPFKNNSFDEVILDNVIEHLDDDKKCIDEIYRILRNNSLFCLSVPNKNNLHTMYHKSLGFKNYFTDRTHKREYSKNEIKSLVSTKFKIINFQTKGFFPPFGLKIMHLIRPFIPIDQFFDMFYSFAPNHCAQIKIIAKK